MKQVTFILYDRDGGHFAEIVGPDRITYRGAQSETPGNAIASAVREMERARGGRLPDLVGLSEYLGD